MSEKPCRRCSLPLDTPAERAIGIHTWCLKDSTHKQTRIPRPGYRGRR